MTAVVVQKLTESDGFIVSDLDGAPTGAGIVRLAPKILVDGATTLARSMTYLFASFEQQISGASGGINAKPEDRAAAIEAFVAQAGPLVADGSLHLRAGKGLGDDDLEPLRAQQPGATLDPASARSLLGSGACAAAAAARGGLDGARVAIDGLEPANASLLAALAEAGATSRTPLGSTRAACAPRSTSTSSAPSSTSTSRWRLRRRSSAPRSTCC